MSEGTPTTAGEPGAGRTGSGSVLGLRIPVDAGLPLSLMVLRLSLPELSDAIGGGLLEDALTGERDGSGYVFHVDAHRVAKGLPGNERAAILSARLGHVTRAWLADLRGDVPVLGCDRHLDDASVPRFVVGAAVRSGLFGTGAGVESAG
ncbi:MAG TPA: hypothetical protein VFP72_24070 [Kineosporiaceae bacterium]|nr:hypothetical protein [Kineosporiaceae bacterium]